MNASDPLRIPSSESLASYAPVLGHASFGLPRDLRREAPATRMRDLRLRDGPGILDCRLNLTLFHKVLDKSNSLD